MSTIVEFPWGYGIRNIKSEWSMVILKPTGQEIDVSMLNVTLSVLGIEFEGMKNNG